MTNMSCLQNQNTLLGYRYPEKIIKIPIDITKGISDAQAESVVDALEAPSFFSGSTSHSDYL